MTTAPYRRVGRITKPHGSRGEVGLALTRGIDAETIARTTVWAVPPMVSGPRALRVTGLRVGAKGPIALLSDDRGPVDAGALAGRWLLAREDELPRAHETTDAWIGAEVDDAARGRIGYVTEVIQTGANDVLVVSGGAFGEVLVPVIDDVILRVDERATRIDVRLLPGLIEDDDL